MPELLRAPMRAVVSPVLDSTRWDDFEPRDGDIVVATFAKVGTTWTQRIVDLLVHQTPDVRPVLDIAPWLDSTIFNPIEDDLATLKAQTHRRYIKSHLPFDALPVWDSVRYVHVGRDGRDARLSWQNHIAGFRPEAVEKVVANAIKLAQKFGAAPMGPPPGPPTADPRAFLRQWMDMLEAAPPDGPGQDPHYFDFEATYWRERKRPNLLFVHYDDMIEDLDGEMRRISDFLEIDTPRSLMPKLVEAARFSTMKAQGDDLAPMLRTHFDRGADRFINQGRSGRWREVLEPEDIARYEAIAAHKVSPALANWLANGRRGAGDPRDAED